jgi:hypothetical protein
LLKEPVHEEGVKHEYHTHERLPEPHGRVLMVMAARFARFTVLVLMPA